MSVVRPLSWDARVAEVLTTVCERLARKRAVEEGVEK
jgi:hypothetical protein